jgi:Na+-driven multidrug efflux pump
VIVAAFGVGLRILTFIIIPAMGLAMATTTLVGQNMGAGKVKRAEQTTLVASLLSFFLPTLAGAILFMLARPISAIFVPKSGAAIEESATFIRITAFSFGLIGLQHVITGALRGAGDTMAAMMLSLIATWVILFPLAYVLSRHTSLGARGIWWSYPIANVISAILCVIWFLGGDWKDTRLLDQMRLKERVREEAQIDEGIS